MKDARNKKSGSKEKCGDSGFRFSFCNSKKMSQMMREFCGGDGTFDCKTMMRKMCGVEPEKSSQQ
jgi:hypothetical protein